ncbi:sensor domain-containing protein [Haloarcula litorea]|uniref:sensor domain-containing protein n=1 Tax=Haloarcula litorea TaxID=3032579 RepID=UPI0023E8288D|nr:sensor domain-containing protein [Halomicroarcula sp. GDY20]
MGRIPADDRTLRRAARTVLAAPVRTQTYRNLLYLLVAFPLGVVYLVVFSVGLSLGLGLLPILVGVPVLALFLGVALAIAEFERRLSGALLDRPIEHRRSLDGETPRERTTSLLTDPRTWGAVVYLPVKFAVGTLALIVALTSLSTAAALLFVPFYYDQPGVYVGFVTDRPVELHPALYIGWNNLLVGFDTVLSVGAWRVRTLPEALVVAALGAVLMFAALALLNALAVASGWLTSVLLGGGYDIIGRYFASSAE